MDDESRDWSKASPTELVMHVALNFHDPAYQSIDEITEQLDALLEDGGANAARAEELIEAWEMLVRELLSHFRKEENVLFPMIESLAPQSALRPPEAMLRGPTKAMVHEHVNSARLFGRVVGIAEREPWPEPNAAIDQLISAIDAFGRALRQHIAFEDEFLFPRALELAAQ